MNKFGKSNLIRFIITFLLIGTSIATNYCRADLCEEGFRHIGCGNNGDWGYTCRANKSIEPMTRELRKFILKKHNTARNMIALGKVPGYLPADRMPKMTWDMELAKLAEFNVKTCQYGHDQCRNTDKFLFAGQNIAEVPIYYKLMKQPTKIINDIFDDYWFNEYKDCNMTYIDEYPYYSEKTIGHFTQIVAMRAKKVGCALSKYQSEHRNFINFYLVCNYSFTNIFSDFVYTTGAPGSRCKSKRNKAYSGLCNPREDVQLKPRCA